jgi:hypothetical protein
VLRPIEGHRTTAVARAEYRDFHLILLYQLHPKRTLWRRDTPPLVGVMTWAGTAGAERSDIALGALLISGVLV